MSAAICQDRPTMRGEWIANRLRQLGKRQSDMAEALQLPRPRISEIIAGKRNIQAREMETVAKFLECSQETLIASVYGDVTDELARATSESEDIPTNQAPPTEAGGQGARGIAATSATMPLPSAQSLQMIPLFDVRVSAGPGALVETDGQPVGHVPFDPAWLKSITYAPTQKLALVRISGDSMWETLHDGDQALVDLTVRKPSRDGIYVLRHEEDVLVKRLQVRFDVQKIEVISDNPKYKSYLASPEDVKVVGRVIWIGRQV